jgi:hypothetical protein
MSPRFTKRLQGVGAMGVIFQPFPKIFGRHAEAAGGNAMGLSGKDADRFVLELPGLYINKGDEEVIQEWGQEFTRMLEERLKRDRVEARGKGFDITEYNPHFMNDAGPDQNCLRTYKDHRKFEALQREVDPKGMFRKRAGGYSF